MNAKRLGDEAVRERLERLYEHERVLLDAVQMIGEVLKQKGVTQKELADRLNRSTPYVSQLLRGDRNFTLKTLVDIMHVLDYRLKLRYAGIENREFESTFRLEGDKVNLAPIFYIQDSPHFRDDGADAEPKSWRTLKACVGCGGE